MKINSNRVKAYRKLNNYNQKDVAEKIGCSLNSYNSKENGRVPFMLTEAKIVADLFNTSVDELFYGHRVHFTNTMEG